MELFLSIPTINHSEALNLKFPGIPFHLTRRNFHFRQPRFLISSKKSSFQDFQEYAKPRQLLPTKELKIDGDEPPGTILSAFQLDGSNSLYKVKLCTSSMYGSDLSDLNAGILVCIIDEHGNSILERIPAITCENHMMQSEDGVTSDVIRFQRGATDEYVFWGPKLGRIQAMWISLESGSWRLGGANLTIVSVHNNQKEEFNANGASYCSLTCNFEVQDVFLGEGSDLAMAELRPCLVTEQFGADSVSIIDGNSSQAASQAEKGITKEDSMREYENLKYSLLLYDAMLIFAGTSITSFTGGKNTALAFLTGGIGGFLYLFFLQRSVDALPAPKSMDERNNFNRLFGGLKGPILVFVSAFAIAILATKQDKPDFIAALTPREILAGMTLLTSIFRGNLRKQERSEKYPDLILFSERSLHQVPKHLC